MKRFFNYMMLCVWACLTLCCSDDVMESSPASSKLGDEVLFGLSLPETSSSRTIYGFESNNAFPVYWVNGDKVQIFSPQCLESRNNAEYEVAVGKENQNFADKLTKTGDAGLQWGAEDADFYSIYPSANATFEVVKNEDNTIKEAFAYMKIAPVQNGLHTWEEKAKAYNSADMDNVIMYAINKGVTNGSTVDLNYIPFSTVLDFELSVKTTAKSKFVVDTLVLEAPQTMPISGKFKLKFPNEENGAPEISSAGENSNKIEMIFGVRPEIKKDTVLRAKINLIPMAEVKNLNGWKITVKGRDGDGVKKYALTLDNNKIATSLAPGKIHKIKLPGLDAQGEWKLDLQNWIENLPGGNYKTVYLTELSIPGAWYARGKGYQDDDGSLTVKSLWDAGIRAFAVECRAYTKRNGITGLGNIATKSPERLCVSGYNTSDKNGATTNTPLSSGVRYISEVISDISKQVSNSNELAVLVLNYADGGDHGQRPEYDHKYFLAGIQKEITESEATNIISSINNKTMIGNVLNSLIIVVNVDKRVNYGVSGVNALFAPAALANEKKADGTTAALKTDSVYFSPIVNNTWASTNYKFTSNATTLSADNFYWSFSTANRTQKDGGTNSDLPTFSQRKNALEAMMSHSKEIYDKSNHNVWFYFNAGGAYTTSYIADTDAKSFAADINPELLKYIKRKINGYTDATGKIHKADPSPLGIVMYNFSTGSTYKGDQITQSLIEMNNKFTLKRGSEADATLYDTSLQFKGNLF